MKKLYRSWFPVFREKGKISGNSRNLKEEFDVLEEPDPDEPEKWLNEYRSDKEKWDNAQKRAEKLTQQFDLDNENLLVGGQSHIDVAWKWRYWQTLRKVIVTYRKAVYHINNHPSYTFVSSQPLLLEWILREDPELFKEIQEASKSGRFDLCGGMYVEPDCHLPSGESFVRQRLYGQLFYRKYFGKISRVEWVPDSFGYANTLPQIFLKSGTPYFYSTKLSNNKTTRFPFVNFLWESPDGSQVLTCINPGSWNAFTLHSDRQKYRRLLKNNDELSADYNVGKPEDLDLFSSEYPSVVAFVGKGDGGHGPTGEELLVMDELVKNNRVEWTTATDYFDNILEQYRDRLPVWKDELYYEFHRGTITTQKIMKRMNRYFEWRLCTFETLCSLYSIMNRANLDQTFQKLKEIWKSTLLHQFHDVLPGSSIPEVYDDCYDMWDHYKTELDNLETNLWTKLIKPQQSIGVEPDTIIVYNGSGFDVEDMLIEIPWYSSNIPEYVMCNEVLTPVQFIQADEFDLDENLIKRPDRLIFKISAEQHSFEVVHTAKVDNEKAEKSQNAASNVEINELDQNITIENKYYILKVSEETGNIVSLINKENKQETFSSEGSQIRTFYDWFPDEQCWNILPTYRTLEIDQSEPASVQITEQGPIRYTIEITRPIENEDSDEPINAKSTLIQRISLMRDMKGIYIDFLIDWHTCSTILKWDLFTKTDAEWVVAETPYGTSKRSTKQTAIHDIPRWENYHHTWVDIASKDNKWGLAVISNGNYGYDAVEGRLGLTVIRGPKYPIPSKEAWVNDERERRFAKTNTVPVDHADMGKHLIQYILLPHKGNWKDSRPFIPKYAHWFNEGYCASVEDVPIGTLDSLSGEGLIWSNSENLEITSIKNAENSNEYVIRAVETKCESASVKISFNGLLHLSKIVETNLLEDDNVNTSYNILRNNENILIGVEFNVKPHEIKTFKIS